MDGLRQYLLGVICAAMICGVVLSLFPEGTIRAWLQLVCGIFLSVTLLAPVDGGRISLPSLPDYSSLAKQEAQKGTQMAADSQRAVIKQSLEAYVLDKAKVQEADISMEVHLSDGELPVPVAVSIRGNVTPEQKQAITEILTEDLGIPKEAQTWNGAA